jgi:hypothetical protein
MAVSSFFLSDPYRTIALAIQAGFYGLALADPWIPERFSLKEISSLPRTFVVMMLAALKALKVFFVPARSLWKVTGASPVERVEP